MPLPIKRNVSPICPPPPQCRSNGCSKQTQPLPMPSGQPQPCLKLPDQEGWSECQRSLRTIAFTRKLNSLIPRVCKCFIFFFPFSFLQQWPVYWLYSETIFLFVCHFILFFGEGGCHVTVALQPTYFRHVFGGSKMIACFCSCLQ